MFQCLSCPPVPGSSQYPWSVLIIFTAFAVQCEHLVLVSHCKQAGFNSLERILWNEAPFPQQDFSLRKVWRGAWQSSASSLLQDSCCSPVLLQLQVCCVCREMHLSASRDCPSCHRGARGATGAGRGKKTVQGVIYVLHFMSSSPR